MYNPNPNCFLPCTYPSIVTINRNLLTINHIPKGETPVITLYYILIPTLSLNHKPSALHSRIITLRFAFYLHFRGQTYPEELKIIRTAVIHIL